MKIQKLIALTILFVTAGTSFIETKGKGQCKKNEKWINGKCRKKNQSPIASLPETPPLPGETPIQEPTPEDPEAQSAADKAAAEKAAQEAQLAAEKAAAEIAAQEAKLAAEKAAAEKAAAEIAAQEAQLAAEKAAADLELARQNKVPNARKEVIEIKVTQK